MQRFSTLCRVKTKQRNRLFDVNLNALINVSIQNVFNRGALLLCKRGLIFQKLTKTPLIYSISYFYWGAGSFVWGDNGTKTPHGNETGSTAAQWWGRAWDCSWNSWLKWIKANNKQRMTQRALKTSNLQMTSKKPMLSLMNNSCLMKLKNLCWHFCKYSGTNRALWLPIL